MSKRPTFSKQGKSGFSKPGRPGKSFPNAKSRPPKPAHGQTGAYTKPGQGKHTSAKAQGKPREPYMQHHRTAQPQAGYWLYGLHAARAALTNPRRKIYRAVLTERAAAEIGQDLLNGVSTEIVAIDQLVRLLPPGSVHQGVALQAEPLPRIDLDTVLANVPRPAIVAVLDQITDPHNEGAILRSAAAFGVAAVIVQDRNAPNESGVLAKAASGALDVIPRIVTVNITRALEELGRLGFWRIALTGDGEATLTEARASGDIALVLGAEGAGIRRLVRETCDAAAYIPMPGIADNGVLESLNVSNAAAIAFYELNRKP